MNVDLVMDQVAAALDEIPGLRVTAWPADRVTPPAAVVSWPNVTYDSTFVRGGDQLLLPVYVLVASTDGRSARANLAPYLAGSGDKSVKAAIDGGLYTACDLVRVASASVEAMTVGDVPYLAAAFSVEVIGMGATS